MNTVTTTGHIDQNHRLSAEVPDWLPVGPITVVIVPRAQEDEAGQAWAAGVAEEWAGELEDVRQDIYTMADGEPVNEA